jgi:hypothetical protein
LKPYLSVVFRVGEELITLLSPVLIQTKFLLNTDRGNKLGTNPFFNHYNHSSESQLHKELTQECIQMTGVDCYYIPRVRTNQSSILTEDPLSTFDNAYEIEGYVEDIEGFGGQGDFLTKFGIQIDDQLTITLSTLSFEDFVLGRTKPQEGDLIFFPLGKGSIYEIHFVEDEKPFYQMGSVPSWELTTKLFQYSSERFNTGITELDELQYENAYVVDVTLSAGTGNYTIGENVHQPATNVVATVASWNGSTKIIGLQDLTDAVNSSATLVGNTSGTTYTISTFDEFEFPHDDAAQNEEIKDYSDDYAEFDSNSPFGGW